MIKSKAESSNQKILWAVDAFPDSPDVQAQAGRAVRMLLEGLSGTIEPVFVSRPAPPGLFVLGKPSLDRLKPARENVDSLLKLVQLNHVTSPKFLFSPSPSVGSMVKTLLDYAKKEAFDLIVAGTHARKGVPRLFMGSFAERLITESPIPVLVTNSKANVGLGKKVKHFLFPTDFSEQSSEVFESVIALAKNLEADILVFHQEEFIYPQVGYPFVVPPVSEASLTEMRTGWECEGEKWIERARLKGVSAKFHLGRSGTSAATAIVKAAKKLPSSIIAMASQSNAIESAFLGSVARQVIRSAPCPVYVIHPRLPEKTAEEPLFQLTEGDLPGPGKALLS
jgi:nucleotide-binding universal stress UspA family protein